MTEFDTLRLDTILKRKDLEKTLELINQGKWKELKAFLNTLDYLLKADVLPDYLYYMLEAQLK